ncbi:PTS IIA-like nitrogen regulatory protein PtsN [Kineobactrum salinum]|uniref:PTS IIA-like nitrogen regulatory protein PtsN n=1 Tax=Kineobactrum salinum TaxID=2708301 RepID=A0A6C0U3I5_9GAMM|nr:PTS IIA-like nitrogen regulatory protein PtsN [Kineobactrum salinum]QIB66586.1 PTS IIA-like nitrogen regulatory protein PtsN [Kineobactrum salinum]
MQVLSQLLTPGRTLCRVPGTSKKRLFEILSGIISRDQPKLTETEVFGKLIARERLGSTGLGGGIAIPHCRIASCEEPLGALVTLADPIDFEAPDDAPVDLLFVLLVPEEAQQAHLDILARIARLFSQSDFCEQLRSSADDAELFTLATSWST